jgi:uncharacterized DUF497 family protein
MHMSTYT